MISQFPEVTRDRVVELAHLFQRFCYLLSRHALEPLVFASLAAVILVTNNASAQQVDPDLDEGRKLYIQRVSPGELSTVQVGQTMSGIAIERAIGNGLGGPEPSETTYALWKLEPAGIARIITTMPVSPLTQSIEIEFLQPGTVTLTAYGFDDEEEADESNEPGFNTTVFTFNVESTTLGGDVNQASLLSANARAVLSTCQAINTTPAGDTGGQGALRDTCNSIALEDNPAASLDRLIPEEFFAMSDALTTTADSQISNIQSRITTVRNRQRTGIDIDSLSLNLWDQPVNGSVLAASKNALWQLSDSNTSQDIISDSPIGMFANGNITVGSIDGDGTQRDADIRTNSLTIGADYRIDNNRVVGVALGTVNDNTNFKADNGDMDMQGINISAFGTWFEQNKGYADVIVDVGRNSFDLTRRINLIGQGDEFANSTSNATRLSVSINAGRTFHRGAIEFGPVGRITITRATINGFSETSTLLTAGAGTTFDVKSHTMTSGRFSVGGEIKRVINTSKAVFVPSMRIELENESETDKGAITVAFRNDPDKNEIQIIGSERDSNALLLSLGSTAVFAHGHSAFVFYETRAQDKFVKQHKIRFGYRMHF